MHHTFRRLTCHLSKITAIPAYVDEHMTNKQKNISIRQMLVDNRNILHMTLCKEIVNFLEAVVIKEK